MTESDSSDIENEAKGMLDLIEKVLEENWHGDERTGAFLVGLSLGLAAYAFQILLPVHDNDAALTADHFHDFIDKVARQYTPAGRA